MVIAGKLGQTETAIKLQRRLVVAADRQRQPHAALLHRQAAASHQPR